MAKYKIVHYINQFFAGIGGEEKADYTSIVIMQQDIVSIKQNQENIQKQIP